LVTLKMAINKSYTIIQEQVQKVINRKACAFCGAAIGEPCRSKQGAPIYQIGQMHEARLSNKRKVYGRNTDNE
jgi:hypothetical protein